MENAPIKNDSSFILHPSSFPEEGVTFRRAGIAIGMGIVLIVLTAVGIRYSEMVTGRYISHGVPPLPAFATVLVLSQIRPLLRRYAPRLEPSRGQILLLYMMLATSTLLSGSY